MGMDGRRHYDGPMSPDLALALHAAKEAGKIIRKAFGRKKTIIKKGAHDFTTDTDTAAEEAIITLLRPTGYSILGEENGAIGHEGSRKWIIDPLDGTLNFIRGIPFFAVSIALQENGNGLILGVVYDPISDTCYCAEQNERALLNDRPIGVGRSTDRTNTVLLMEHGKDGSSRNAFVRAFNTLMLDRTNTLLRQGSTALMLCHIADGSFEGFLSFGDALYDYAAGLVIAREAGASFSDCKGRSWNPTSDSLLVAEESMRLHILSQLNEAHT